MRLFKRILFGLLVVLVLAALGFVIWAEIPLGPAPEALAALQSDNQVQVTQGSVVIFQPAHKKPSTGFIFYPGGHIDARSYAAPLHQIAAQDFLVILTPMPLNLAIFSPDRAGDVIVAYPNIQHWAIGGHSFGGVVAAMYASKHDDIQGLVFWASYPANHSLKDSSIGVISIYGSDDLAGTSTFDQYRSLLPSDTQYVVIQGGNHSQFGDYGLQPGDNPAEISRADQQKQAVDATVRFLQALSK